MNPEEAAAAAEFIAGDWVEHPSPLSQDASPPAPGRVDVRPGAGDGWTSYSQPDDPEPTLVDDNRWKRVRLLDATAVAQVINVVFEWPSDAVEPHKYMLVVDVAETPSDHRLTSSVIWAMLFQILSIPEWTTRCTTPVSERLSVVLQPSNTPAPR